jgi:hypothetical protein
VTALLVVTAVVAMVVTTTDRPIITPSHSALVELTRTALELFAVAALAGLGSMILLQTAKVSFRLRGIYQERQIVAWLGRPAVAELIGGLGGHVAGRGPRAGDRRSLFDLPIEQVAAQISAVTDLALVEPVRYRSLLDALVGRGGKPMLDALMARGSAAGESSVTPRGVRRHAPSEDAEADDLRLEVGQLVRTGIAALQVSVGRRWTFYLRMSAVLLSAALAAVSAVLARLPGPLTLALLSVTLVFGGFFAWLAHDLAALVRRRP